MCFDRFRCPKLMSTFDALLPMFTLLDDLCYHFCRGSTSMCVDVQKRCLSIVESDVFRCVEAMFVDVFKRRRLCLEVV
jgi:hypothetical protein